MTGHAHLRAFSLTALLVGVLWIMVLPSCGKSPAAPESEADRPRVVVSITPLLGLIEPMLPDDAEIEVLVPAGRTIHGFEPSPADMATLARADLVVLVGLGLEGRLDEAVRHGGSKTKIVTMAGVLGIEGDGHHHHDDDHDHGEEFKDPHLWLDPVLAADFVRRLPDHMPEQIQSRIKPVDDLIAGIEAVDAEYRERLAPFAGRAIVTHHASMSRVAERYGLRVAAVLRAVETIEPAPADIAKARRAIEAGGAAGVGAIFVEPQFSGSSAQRLAESAGVKMVVLDPLGDGDWFKMMRTNLDGLVEGLSVGNEQP